MQTKYPFRWNTSSLTEGPPPAAQSWQSTSPLSSFGYKGCMFAWATIIRTSGHALQNKRLTGVWFCKCILGRFDWRSLAPRSHRTRLQSVRVDAAKRGHRGQCRNSHQAQERPRIRRFAEAVKREQLEKNAVVFYCLFVFGRLTRQYFVTSQQVGSFRQEVKKCENMVYLVTFHLDIQCAGFCFLAVFTVKLLSETV